MFPLHNGTVGSYFGYLLNAPLGLAEEWSDFMKALYGGAAPSKPDTRKVSKLADGVYLPTSWREEFPEGDFTFGETSIYYASRLAQQKGRVLPVGGIVEPSYFHVEAYGDQRLSGLTRRQAQQSTVTRALQNINFVGKLVNNIDIAEGEIGGDLYRDVILYVDYWIKDLEAELHGSIEKPNEELTVSEVTQMITLNNFYPTVPLGMLANLAQTVESPHTAQVTARLRQESDFLTTVLAPRLEPLRYRQAQRGAVHQVLVQRVGLVSLA